MGVAKCRLCKGDAEEYGNMSIPFWLADYDEMRRKILGDVSGGKWPGVPKTFHLEYFLL